MVLYLSQWHFHHYPLLPLSLSYITESSVSVQLGTDPAMVTSHVWYCAAQHLPAYIAPLTPTVIAFAHWLHANCPSSMATSHLSFMLFVLFPLTKVTGCQQYSFTVHTSTWKGWLSLKANPVPTYMLKSLALKSHLSALPSHCLEFSCGLIFTLNQYASSLSKVMTTWLQ